MSPLSSGHVKFEYTPGSASHDHDTVSDWKTVTSRTDSSLRIDSSPPNRTLRQRISNLNLTPDWKMIFSMLLFTILGSIISLSHHIFLTTLHLRPLPQPNTQRLVSLGNTAFIFVSKLFFSLAIAKAYEQRVWFTVNRNFIKVKGLDALFSVLNPGNPFAFFSLEMVKDAKVATAIAAVVWLLPFAVVPIPGALTIQTRAASSVQDVVVPHVNLLENPRVGEGGEITVYDDFNRKSGHANLLVGIPRLIFFVELYQGPSTSIQNLATRSLLSPSISPWLNPCPASSCSYNQTFFAPSFNCSPPENVTNLFNGLPLARWSASAETGLGADALNVTWVSSLNPTTVLSTNCTSFNSTYDITISFDQGERSSGPGVAINRIVLGQQFGTADPRNWSTPTGGNSSSPVDRNPFGHAFLASIKDAVTSTLAGNVFIDSDIGIITPDLSLVLLSPTFTLGNGRNLTFQPNTNTLIQDLLTNTTLNLLSQNLWTTSTPALIEESQLVFVYDPTVLWIGYTVSIGLTLITVGVGLYSAARNGSESGGRDTRFSTLARSVMGNPVLDRYMELRTRELSEGAFRREFLELKLRYGRIGTPPDGQVKAAPQEGRRKMGFGIETQLGREDS
ncbi:hypothetical protein AAF712_002887 [Marasmius tenuissimus]|uniref:Uncharacterized protein n=1 Tax=Marasmius tenuissimus TaxID=585030 RepID=A0ABR3A7L5_9AGAR